MEIRQILEENDFSLVVEHSGATGNNLSRAECEAIVNQEIGQPTPERTMRFIVHTADDKWFLVFYIKQADKFLYEKLTAR